MSDRKPRVSIGMPVYNGELYLEQAIDSILAQSYTDFELVICDNASADRTREICLTYVKKDQRVHYHRNATNIGASGNYNRVFELSRGEYFKWAAHDDIIAPDFLLKCVEVLDQNPSVVLSFSRIQIIDENGNVKKACKIVEDINFAKPHDRFAYLALNTHACHHIWGLVRRNVLEQTPLLGNYISHDVTLVAEIGLHGPFHVCDESLFMLRTHNDKSIYAYPYYLRATWFDPEKKGKIIFPNWRVFGEHFKSIKRAPLRWNEKLGCYVQMGHWLLVHWNAARLIMDLLVIVFPGLWKVDLRIKAWYHKRKGRSRATRLEFASSRGLGNGVTGTKNE